MRQIVFDDGGLRYLRLISRVLRSRVVVIKIEREEMMDNSTYWRGKCMFLKAENFLPSALES